VNETTNGLERFAQVALADDGAFVVAFSHTAGLTHDLKGRKGGTRASPAIVMDPLPTANGPGIDTMGNGVFEPGETQVLQTAWINDTNEAVASIFGQTPLFSGPPGADYTINDDTAFYDVLPTGSGQELHPGERLLLGHRVRSAHPPDAALGRHVPGNTNMSLPHTWVLPSGQELSRRAAGQQLLPVHRDHLP
jgi:hypothetical protein